MEITKLKIMSPYIEMQIPNLKNQNSEHCFETGIAYAQIPISKWGSPF